MNDVGLDKSIFDKYPSEISGGMKKRVAFARALYKSNEILIMDEPTNDLDLLTLSKYLKHSFHCRSKLLQIER